MCIAGWLEWFQFLPYLLLGQPGTYCHILGPGAFPIRCPFYRLRSCRTARTWSSVEPGDLVLVCGHQHQPLAAETTMRSLPRWHFCFKSIQSSMRLYVCRVALGTRRLLSDLGCMVLNHQWAGWVRGVNTWSSSSDIHTRWMWHCGVSGQAHCSRSCKFHIGNPESTPRLLIGLLSNTMRNTP